MKGAHTVFQVLWTYYEVSLRGFSVSVVFWSMVGYILGHTHGQLSFLAILAACKSGLQGEGVCFQVSIVLWVHVDGGADGFFDPIPAFVS